MEPRSLYLHVPFCARQCDYCDFAMEAVEREPPTERWLNAVASELTRVLETGDRETPLELDTVYVGGGTPSLLGAGAMARLRSRLEPLVGWDADAVEWTVEANPEDVDERLARDWHAAGVNRVVLGVQSFHAPTLRWLGRRHEPEHGRRAVDAVRAAGIDDVSVDLVFGLPRGLERPWAEDVDRALALRPEHVSLYGLTAEAGTPLGRRVRHGRERLADDAEYRAAYLRAAERFTAAGMRHYEVTSFALPGRASRHNSSFWSGAPYLGLGPGAHSYLPPVRRWNLRDWSAYRTAVDAGESPVAERETVDGDGARLEALWSALRTASGVPVRELGPAQERRLREWTARGWAEPNGAAVRLTPRGWLLLDRLVVELDGAASSTRQRIGKHS